MARIFIDTNIYLDLYNAGEDPGAIFHDIQELKSRLIFTDMVFDEFLRNRDSILDNAAGKIGNSGVGGMHPPYFVQQAPAFTSLEAARENYNQAIKDLLDTVNRIISDPDQDPVYTALVGLYQDPDVEVIQRTDADISRAEERRLLGNPPGDVGAGTIGDQVIWEMLLAHAGDDLILVTRDYTYKNHLSFLLREFREKTGHDLHVTEYLSDALKAIGKSPSDALVQFDEAWKMRGG